MRGSFLFSLESTYRFGLGSPRYDGSLTASPPPPPALYMRGPFLLGLEPTDMLGLSPPRYGGSPTTGDYRASP
jgi:hypothetical protein